MDLHQRSITQFLKLAVDVTARAKLYPEFKTHLLRELAKEGIYSTPDDPCDPSLTLTFGASQRCCNNTTPSNQTICNTTLCVTDDYKTNCSIAKNSLSVCKQAYQDLSSTPLLLNRSQTFAQNYTEFATKFHNSLLICSTVEPPSQDSLMRWTVGSETFRIGNLFFKALSELQPDKDPRHCVQILYKMWQLGRSFYNTTCTNHLTKAMNPLPDDITLPLAKEICADAPNITSSFFNDVKNSLTMCTVQDAYGEDQTWGTTSNHIGSDFALALEDLMYTHPTMCNDSPTVFDGACCVQHLYLLWQNNPKIYDTACASKFASLFPYDSAISGPIAQELCTDAPKSISNFFTQFSKSIQLCTMSDIDTESSLWDSRQIGTDINNMLYDLATAVTTGDLTLAANNQNIQFCFYNLFQFYSYTFLQHNYLSFPYCIPLLSGLITAPYYGALCGELCECGLSIAP